MALTIIDLRIAYDDLGVALGELNYLRAPQFSGVTANIRDRIGMVRKMLADEMDDPTPTRKIVPAAPASQSQEMV